MPPRLRPTRLEYVVDGVRLRAQLTAAALEHGDGPAARKAAQWTQERLPSAEQVRSTTAEAANQAMGVAKKGFAWAKDLTTRAPEAPGADPLPRGDVPPAKR